MKDLEKIELVGDAMLMEDFKQTDYYRVLTKYGKLLLSDLMNRVLTGTKEEFDYSKGSYGGACDALNLPDRIIALANQVRETKEVKSATQ